MLLWKTDLFHWYKKQEVDFYSSPENVGKAYANELKAHRFLSAAAIDQVCMPYQKSWIYFVFSYMPSLFWRGRLGMKSKTLFCSG